MKIYATRKDRMMRRCATAVIIFMTVTGSLAGCGRMTDIGKDKAAGIALEDARLKESEVTRLRVSKDTDDGKGIYEVEFTNGNTEYEYEILASNGDILSADYEQSHSLNQTDQTGQQNPSDSRSQNAGQDDGQNTPDSRNQDTPQNVPVPQSENARLNPDSHSHSGQTAGTQANVQIGIEQASDLALDRVPGASAQNLKIELDYDDGYYKYEGDIIYNQKEYEFEIDADTGDFLEWKEERR